MAAIWNNIEIEWEGETYTVRPTMEFINHLERKDGRSISKMYQRLMTRDLPSGAACELIADTINWAGGEAKSMDVFAATSGGVDATAVNLASNILIALMPAPKETAPAPTTKKKSARKRTGGSSTGSQSAT